MFSPKSICLYKVKIFRHDWKYFIFSFYSVDLQNAKRNGGVRGQRCASERLENFSDTVSNFSIPSLSRLLLALVTRKFLHAVRSAPKMLPWTRLFTAAENSTQIFHLTIDFWEIAFPWTRANSLRAANKTLLLLSKLSSLPRVQLCLIFCNEFSLKQGDSRCKHFT